MPKWEKSRFGLDGLVTSKNTKMTRPPLSSLTLAVNLADEKPKHLLTCSSEHIHNAQFYFVFRWKIPNFLNHCIPITDSQAIANKRELSELFELCIFKSSKTVNRANSWVINTKNSNFYAEYAFRHSDFHLYKWALKK